VNWMREQLPFAVVGSNSIIEVSTVHYSDRGSSGGLDEGTTTFCCGGI
jgi:hypothetical protein